jgi:hypothetical protein
MVVIFKRCAKLKQIRQAFVITLLFKSGEMTKQEGKSPKTTPNRVAQQGHHSSEDFYFNEQGFMVFTESYHLKRGYCCKSNCRHCPYSQKKK